MLLKLLWKKLVLLRDIQWQSWRMEERLKFLRLLKLVKEFWWNYHQRNITVVQINNVSMSQIKTQNFAYFLLIVENHIWIALPEKMSRSSYSQKLSSLKAAAMAKIAGVASADDNDDDDIPPPPPPEDTKFENDFLFFFRCVNFHMSFWHSNRPARRSQLSKDTTSEHVSSNGHQLLQSDKGRSAPHVTCNLKNRVVVVVFSSSKSFQT